MTVEAAIQFLRMEAFPERYQQQEDSDSEEDWENGVAVDDSGHMYSSEESRPRRGFVILFKKTHTHTHTHSLTHFLTYMISLSYGLPVNHGECMSGLWMLCISLPFVFGVQAAWICACA